MGQFVSERLCSIRKSGVQQKLASADYMQGTRLSFRSKEDAMHFAEKQGMPAAVLHLSKPSDILTVRMGLLCVGSFVLYFWGRLTLSTR